jgi:hypothetical protein
MKAALPALAMLVLAACGGATPAANHTPDASRAAVVSPSPASTASPSAVASPSAPASPIASPNPFVPPSAVPALPSTPKPVVFACSSTIPAGAQLALVTLRGSTDVAVRDITNISSPVSRCAFKYCEQFCSSYGPTDMRFVTSTSISYIVRSVDGDGAMYLVDLLSGNSLLVRSWGQQENYFWVFAWSPDGNSLTYFTSTDWRIRTAAADVALSPLGKDLGYNFNRDTDSRMVGFSADGHYVAIDMSIDQGVTSTAGGYTIQKAALFEVVRISDKNVVYSRSDGTMATWAGAGASLYFRTGSGLEEWDSVNGARLIAPGLGWTNSVPSSDGQRIAYLLASSIGYHSANDMVLTAQALQPTTLSSLHRTDIAFLKPTLVWYAEEAPCNDTPCRCDDAICEPQLSGNTYVHDLVTGQVSASVVTSVRDVWPRLGSQ